MLCVDPDVREIAAASPRVATEAGDDFPSVVPNAACQELPVEVPGGPRVELVDALREEQLQLLALSFTEQGNRKSHDHPEEGQVATLVIRRARAAPMRFRRKLPQQLL